MRCPSCDATTINGIACHETGCPDKALVLVGEMEGNYSYECAECGCEVFTEVRPGKGRICNTCAFGDRPE
jgi:hypothetical protein